MILNCVLYRNYLVNAKKHYCDFMQITNGTYLSQLILTSLKKKIKKS